MSQHIRIGRKPRRNCIKYFKGRNHEKNSYVAYIARSGAAWYEDFRQNFKNYTFRGDWEDSMCPMHLRFPDLFNIAQDLFNDNFEIFRRHFLTELCQIKN